MKTNPWVWVTTAAAGAGAIALMWSHFANDPHDTDWTDPHQPPAMVAVPAVSIGGRPTRGCDYGRAYPSSLSDWDASVVGEC